MQGDVDDQMIAGIDSSEVVAVFVTTDYLAKVASRDDHDNCRKEFKYAGRQDDKKQKIIGVPMEPDCMDPRAWKGPVGLRLGGDLYECSFPTDLEDDAFEVEVKTLFDWILRVVG